MEFFTITEVVNRRYSRFLKILLGTICFLDLFVLVVELLSAGEIGAIYIVPLIILVPAFFRMGTKKYSADVLCNLSKKNDYIELVMSNVIIDKNEVLSRSYSFKQETLSVLFNKDLGKVYLIGNGRVELLDQKKKVVFGEDFTQETIELVVKKTTFEDVSDFFKEYVKQ